MDTWEPVIGTERYRCTQCNAEFRPGYESSCACSPSATLASTPGACTSPSADGTPAGVAADPRIKSADVYRREIWRNVLGFKALSKETREIDGESEYAPSLISKQKQLAVELAEVRKALALGYQMARDREAVEAVERDEQIVRRLEDLEARSRAH